MSHLTVVKRNGDVELFDPAKITARLENLDPHPSIDLKSLLGEITASATDRIHTSLLDDLSANIAWRRGTQNPHYIAFASKIMASNLAKNTPADILTRTLQLEKNRDRRGVRNSPFSPGYAAFVKKHAHEINKHIDYSRDALVSPSGFNVLKNKYLLRSSDGALKERFQDLLMRVAVDIHRPRGKAEADVFDERMQAIWETYEGMSQMKFIHATPTLFNAGMKTNQYFSCFLLGVDDSLDSIMGLYSQVARISKSAGGIGIHLSAIRSAEALIRSTGGESNGIAPLCQVLEKIAAHINQGGKRAGSIAVYCEAWHRDIRKFLELPRHDGLVEDRARDLFYAMWLDDEFMRRVEADELWYLFDPDEFPGLSDAVGPKFVELYNRYIEQVRGDAEYCRKYTIKARELYASMINCQIETGRPYMLSKDSCNNKSNQKNLGTIRSSNLCAEIVEYSDAGESACCCLASMCLPKFVIPAVGAAGRASFDFEDLGRWVRVVVRNLDRTVEYNSYPTPETRRSNLKNRPLGIGVQGLADVFIDLGLVWGSEEALALDARIHETMYYHAMDESCRLAARYGRYENFDLNGGCPLKGGQFQFNLWGMRDEETTGGFDWAGLRGRVAEVGVRNSLLLALMPTASTSLIMGNNECFEPYSSHLYVRRTLSGEIKMVNHRLINMLIGRGLWNDRMYLWLVEEGGLIGKIDEIPEDIRMLFRTAFEMPMKSTVIEHARRRSPFICQSMSLNLFVSRPRLEVLSSMHMYTWRCGLKTMQYYLRSRAELQNEKIGARGSHHHHLAALATSVVSGSAAAADEHIPTDGCSATADCCSA